MVDWAGILEALTGKSGWEDADGPDTGVGDDYWYANGDDTFARLNVDQGYASLTVAGDDEKDSEEVWSGEIENLATDPALSKFVTPDPSITA